MINAQWSIERPPFNLMSIDLKNLTIKSAHDHLVKGDFTSVELTQAYLDVIAKKDKEINAYIQTHSLQDKSNGRKINPDAKLTQLLKISKEDELTYFNLQKFMKHHFVKAEVPGAVATA